jgi:GNAT superfamily N-acetyltransferase
VVPGAAYAAHAGVVTRDRDDVISVWRGNLGRASQQAAKYDWFYGTCPWGLPLLQMLRHEPSAAWVGTAAAGPRRMTWRGCEVRAGVLVDIAVDARHRTLGPALILQSALLDAATSRFDLLYGFPNAKALPVVKRLGYAVIAYMPRHSRVLRHGDYLARHLPVALARPLGWLADIVLDTLGALRGRRLATRWSDSVDPRMDTLWHDSEHGHGPLAVRDTALLRWRFDQSPMASVRYLLVSERDDGPLLGWFACQVKERTLQVCDFWSVDAAQGVGRRLIDTLVRVARRDGHAAVSIEYAAPARKLVNWRRAGFVERSRRPVIGRWLQDRVASDEAPLEWHLTPADEDE